MGRVHDRSVELGVLVAGALELDGVPGLMTWKLTAMSRTFSTWRIQREAIQHQGHGGSNQKSTR